MKPDRGLVQHVEDARETGPDLARKTDALALAARQRAGIARQRQVDEPDIDEEMQPIRDFFQDPRGNLELLGVELQPASPKNQSFAASTR